MEQGSQIATPSGGTRSQGDCVTEVCSYMDIPYNLYDDNGMQEVCFLWRIF